MSRAKRKDPRHALMSMRAQSKSELLECVNELADHGRQFSVIKDEREVWVIHYTGPAVEHSDVHQ